MGTGIAMSRFSCTLSVSCVVGFFAIARAASCSSSSKVYEFQFGEFNATIFQDSVFRFTTNPMLVPEEVALRAVRFYSPGMEVPSASLNVLLLERNGKRYLVDTGLGPSGGGSLQQLLREASITPSSINGVLITHAHGDHILGLIGENGAAAFPNARVYVYRDEFNFWTTDPVELGKRGTDLEQGFINTTTSGFVGALKPYLGKVVLVDNTQRVFDNSVEIVHTPGHTPGHMAVRIHSMGKTLFCTGDSVFTRTTSYHNPSWNIFSDTNRTQSVITRLSMLDSLVKDQSLVLGFHHAFPGLGYVIPQGPWFDFVAAPIAV